MSSDLFVHGDSSSSSLFHCSSSDLVFPSDADFQYLSDPYSPNFTDHAIDFQTHYPHQIPLPTVDSNSNYPMQGLPLSHCNDFPLIPDSSSTNGFQNLSNFEVKNEESHLGFTGSNSFNPPLEPLCFDPSDNNGAINKSLLQRSFSEKPALLYQSHLESLLMDSPNFPCSESEFFSSQIRRVFSTGDLQNSGMGPFSSPLSENGSLEEGNFKVGKYSAEERKEKISKYRAKRTQRNFNKKIKYACRKTLADNRPRIRGRFARNDEPGDNPKAACSTREDEDDDFWMEGLEEETVKEKQYNEMYGRRQFQYCGV